MGTRLLEIQNYMYEAFHVTVYYAHSCYMILQTIIGSFNQYIYVVSDTYHITTSSVHITTCWYPQMLHTTALYQGGRSQTITLPDHNIMLRSSELIDCYEGRFDQRFHRHRSGLERNIRTFKFKLCRQYINTFYNLIFLKK